VLCVHAGRHTRRRDSRVGRIEALDSDEQLYATTTMLPYAAFEQIDCSGLQLSGEAWCALLEAVAKCPGLKVLSIKGCALGSIGERARTAGAVGGQACNTGVAAASGERPHDTKRCCRAAASTHSRCRAGAGGTHTRQLQGGSAGRLAEQAGEQQKG
jgi:hypothetical protein